MYAKQLIDISDLFQLDYMLRFIQRTTLPKCSIKAITTTKKSCKIFFFFKKNHIFCLIPVTQTLENPSQGRCAPGTKNCYHYTIRILGKWMPYKIPFHQNQIWCARNKLTFKNEAITAQRISNLWAWANLFSNANTNSVLDFLTWLGCR